MNYDKLMKNTQALLQSGVVPFNRIAQGARVSKGFLSRLKNTEGGYEPTHSKVLAVYNFIQKETHIKNTIKQ